MMTRGPGGSHVARAVRPMDTPTARQVRRKSFEKHKKTNRKGANEMETSHSVYKTEQPKAPFGTAMGTERTDAESQMGHDKSVKWDMTKAPFGAMGWNKMGQCKNPIFLKRFQRNCMNWGNGLVQNGAMGWHKMEQPVGGAVPLSHLGF